jgi:hypothetical protein
MKHYSLQKGVIIVVLLMLTIIPNLKVYSSVGDYSSQSPALKANGEYQVETQAAEKAAWWQAAAAVISLAYGAVIGTLAHHVYNAIGEQAIAMVSVDYNSADFSKFDN